MLFRGHLFTRFVFHRLIWAKGKPSESVLQHGHLRQHERCLCHLPLLGCHSTLSAGSSGRQGSKRKSMGREQRSMVDKAQDPLPQKHEKTVLRPGQVYRAIAKSFCTEAVCELARANRFAQGDPVVFVTPAFLDGILREKHALVWVYDIAFA